MLLCCSRDALTSPWVNDEIVMALAVERERRKSGRAGVFLLPLLLDGYLMEDYADGKADILSSRVAADFRQRSAKWFEDPQFQRLLQALRKTSSEA
jgi:hypothetical protein